MFKIKSYLDRARDLEDRTDIIEALLSANDIIALTLREREKGNKVTATPTTRGMTRITIINASA